MTNKRSEGVAPIERAPFGRKPGLILCGECFDGGEFKSVGISIARCFCCGAACGSMIASEKRQAYYVNGDRSRVRPERRHLLRPEVHGGEVVYVNNEAPFLTPCRVTVRAGSEVREVEIQAGTSRAEAMRIIAAAWAGRLDEETS